jgi:ABC-type spermidine/putrescine transport system permease subunit I
MTIMNTIIMVCYYVLSVLIALTLARTIVKTKNAQEAVLYCLILMPFLLRIFRFK